MAGTGTPLWVGLPRCSGQGRGVRAAGAKGKGREWGRRSEKLGPGPRGGTLPSSC